MYVATIVLPCVEQGVAMYCVSTVYGSTIFYAAACAECVATMFCSCYNGSTFCSVAAIMVLPKLL